MPAAINYTVGQRFNFLVYLGEAPRGPDKRRKAWFQCDCGSKVKMQPAQVSKGTTLSCGCYAREQSSKRVKTHGRSGDYIYRTWSAMINRCHSDTSEAWDWYGGRGIKVCDRWRYSFENFLEDMGERPSGKSLDRIDVNGNYEPSNCRWATNEEQQNNRRDNVLLEYQGRQQSAAQWARELGISKTTIFARLRKGWTVERALSQKPSSRAPRFIEFNGERLTISDWSRRTGIADQTIAGRLNSGWPVDKALTMSPDSWASRRASF